MALTKAKVEKYIQKIEGGVNSPQTPHEVRCLVARKNILLIYFNELLSIGRNLLMCAINMSLSAKFKRFSIC